MKKSTLIFFALIVCIISCKEEGIYFKLDDEFIDYFAKAKDGSWWVYYNEEQNIRDSFYISDYKIYKQYLNDKSEGDSYQTIKYNLQSTDKINFAVLTIGWMNDKDSSNYFNYNSSYSGISDNYFNNFPTIIKTRDSFRVESCLTCGYEMLPIYQTETYEFESVLKAWKNADTFYFAREIELIRYHVEGKTYLLKSYSIVL